MTGDQANGAVTFALHPCSVVLPPVGGYTPLVDDAFLQQTVPAVEYSGTLTDGTLHAPTKAVLLGVRDLADPATDPLPTSGDEEPGLCSHLLSAFPDIIILCIAVDLSAAFLQHRRPQRCTVPDAQPETIVSSLRSMMSGA